MFRFLIAAVARVLALAPACQTIRIGRKADARHTDFISGKAKA
jgi:hypothetical protein